MRWTLAARWSVMGAFLSAILTWGGASPPMTWAYFTWFVVAFASLGYGLGTLREWRRAICEVPSGAGGEGHE